MRRASGAGSRPAAVSYRGAFLLLRCMRVRACGARSADDALMVQARLLLRERPLLLPAVVREALSSEARQRAKRGAQSARRVSHAVHKRAPAGVVA